jgi:tetratricopeptide (TPR) repeat protein
MKSEAAKVLQFSRRRSLETLSQEDARLRASEYLALSTQEVAANKAALAHPDVLMAVCRELRATWDQEPARVAQQAIDAYRCLEATDQLGVFDERDYFLGELALIAGTACRHLGRLDESEIWLDKSEASFSQTVNPGPSLAGVRYARVGVHYARGKFAHVIDVTPALLDSFERLGMSREALKCRFALASALKAIGRRDECLHLLGELHADDSLARETDLLVLVKMHLGEMLLTDGQVAAAGRVLAEGAQLLDSSKPTIAHAHLNAVLAEALSNERRFAEATVAYRASVAAYRALSMAGYEAHTRLALAESLLSMGDHRQAEWEVLAALPAIDEQLLEPQARAAVALLLQSAKARNTDVRILGEVRRHLKPAS